MTTLSLDIPDELLKRLTVHGRDASQEIRLAAAFSLCSRGELSTSLAARLAGMPYAGFLEAAAKEKVQLFPVDLQEFREEIQRGFTLGRERLADHSACQSAVG